MSKKVDLALLKRMLAELETSLSAADTLKESTAFDKSDWIVEMSKATGLATGLMTEAALITGDIQQVIMGGSAAPGKTDMLEKILGGMKGPPNTN